MPFKAEASLYNLFHQDKNYAEEAILLRKKYKKALTVLEIGAGTGNLTKQLIKQGFIVTVIEPSLEMLKQWKCKGVKRFNSKLEDIPSDTFKKNQFDIVIAHYDVLNYIPREYQQGCVEMLLHWGKKFDWEVWPAKLGVKFFTYKHAGNWHRFRFGIEINNTAHLLFIYLGPGIKVEKHTLYL